MVIVSADAPDARLARALVLIRGELSALDVQVRIADASDASDAALPTPATANERLSLDVKEGVVVVRVYAPGALTPMIESVELDGPDVNAEVIAVRAVEVLRAARLLPAQAPRATLGKPIEAPKPAPAPSPLPLQDPSTPALQLAIGPSLTQSTQGSPQLDGQLGVLIGPRWGFVAVGAGTSLFSSEFERAAGHAQIARRALFLQLGARLRVQRAWELNARGGVSYLHYSANGSAQPGYLDRELAHRTAAVSLSVGGVYYFVRSFGVYLDLGALIALDAARVRVDNQSVATLDRPSISLGAGALLGAF